MEDLTQKLSAMETELQKVFNKQAEEIKNIGSAHSETKTAVDKITADLTDLSAKTATFTEKQQEQLDAINMKLQEFKSPEARKTFKAEFADKLKEYKEQLAALKSGMTGRVGFNMKADMTGAADYTGDVVEPDFDNTIYRDPVQNTLRVRSLLPVATTTSNSFRFIQRSGFSDGTARVGEGATIPQSDFDLTRVTRTIEKYGARMDFTKEMLEDTAFLQSFIVAELVDRLAVVEDNALLYGTGSSEIYGVSAEAGAYLDDGLADSAVQEIDVLINAVKTLEEDHKYSTNGILLAPTEFYKIHRLKDSQENYLNGMLVYDGDQLRLLGIPVFKSTAVTAGDFFVGDWRSYGRIVYRAGAQVEFSDQNGTNFEEDQITAKITQRFLLAATNPNAIVYGDMAVALAQGSA